MGLPYLDSDYSAYNNSLAHKLGYYTDFTGVNNYHNLSYINPTSQTSGSSFPNNIPITSNNHSNMLSLIASGLGAAGSLLGGILNRNSVDKANKQNIELQRETNAQNYKMFHEQNQFNLDMWNKQNEYNDPSQQRARLENAGLNPLFYGLDGTGNASQLTSATPNAALAPSVTNDGGGMLQSLLNIGNIAADFAMKQAQIKNINSDTDLKDAQYDKTNQETANLSVEQQILERDSRVKIETENAEIDAALLSNDLTQQQITHLSKTIEQMDTYLQLAIDTLANQVRQTELQDKIQQWQHQETKRQNDIASARVANDLAIGIMNASIARQRNDIENRKINLDSLLRQWQLDLDEQRLNLSNPWTFGFNTLSHTIGGLFEAFGLDPKEVEDLINSYTHDIKHGDYTSPTRIR